jgi:threonine dehydratase
MITLLDVLAAELRIASFVLRTPLLRTPALDAPLGCRVYLKPENLQHTGSFKLRGATNRLLSLAEEHRRRGVVCASSGNHAQGVACAAERLGIDAVIVVPIDCNPVKLAGIRSFGATVLLEGRLSSEREARAAALAERQGRTVVHPYADDGVRAGQGTIGVEILRDQPEMDAVVVPVGGGGLICGVATAVKGIRPGTRVIGVEPQGAARYSASRAAGRPVTLGSVDTIADGTRTDRANPENFEAIERLVDDLVTAGDAEIRAAMKLALSCAKLVAEPSSVMGMAAAMAGRLPVGPSDRVCFVISGGNNDPALLSKILLQ